MTNIGHPCLRVPNVGTLQILGDLIPSKHPFWVSKVRQLNEKPFISLNNIVILFFNTWIKIFFWGIQHTFRKDNCAYSL